jgi:hypothetical protein
MNKAYINSNFYKVAETDAGGNVTGLMTGNLEAAGVVNFSDVSNVHITGGENNQYLRTDGLGNLTWANVAAGGAAGSNSQVQYNDNGEFAGESTFTYDTVNNRLNVTRIAADGGELSNIAGANVSGVVANANYAAFAATLIGNSIANANFAGFAGNVTIAAQPNITSVGTLTSVTTSGPINMAGSIPVIDMGASDITSVGSTLFFQANSIQMGAASISPGVDETGSLGFDSFRWGDVFATRGNVSTDMWIGGNTTVVGNVSSNNATVANALAVNGNITLQEARRINFGVGTNIKSDGNPSGGLIINDGWSIGVNDISPISLGRTIGADDVNRIVSITANTFIGNTLSVNSANIFGNANVTGNLNMTGVINRTQYKSGEVIRKIALVQTGFNQATTTTVNSTTAVTVAYYLFTPTVPNSRIVIEYDSDWAAPGAGTDRFNGLLKWDNFTINNRVMVFDSISTGGLRGSSVIPMRGVYIPNSTAQANIQYTLSRVAGDDTLTLTNSASFPASLVITEIAP